MAAKELPTMYGLSESDPGQDLIKRAGIAPANLEQIDRIMAEMGRMRQIERRIMRSSQQFMKLNETDMRAIRKMISAKHAGQSVTPGALSQYLGISSASVTKMIDRLEAHGHVRRTRHPTDRRSQCVEVTEETHLAAREQVGRHHAKRFEVANAMSPEERDVVIRFLAGTSDALESSLDSTAAGEAE
ncbi:MULTISPECIES: MarR family winged helix-turn-helix transcriptional regulator [Micrococcaceae]|uniref:MarR family winged helix-turn-helix transcriptional regulator n=1 Tax=Micrococcaceae TaxID=1268 RepID=UPI00105EFB53|nr:MarR family transcriptional regulator [Arthrobacter sp. JUb115]TDU22375.1 MarR family transcriptional regulator [Arthrobacter sp. JUb115]